MEDKCNLRYLTLSTSQEMRVTQYNHYNLIMYVRTLYDIHIVAFILLELAKGDLSSPDNRFKIISYKNLINFELLNLSNNLPLF